MQIIHDLTHHLSGLFTTANISFVIAFIATVLSMSGAYTNAIIARANGNPELAQILYERTRGAILLPVSALAFLGGVAYLRILYHFDLSFILISLVVFSALGLQFLPFLFQHKSEFQMVPLGDRLAIKFLGKIFEDKDTAVIVGRSLATIGTMITLMVAFTRLFLET